MSQPIATSTAPKVSLTFLLLSGKRKTFAFEQADSFASIKERLVHEWPNDWEDETKPETSSAIRLLHLGRLIPDDETLLSNPKFPPSPAPAAVIHLSVRPYPIRAPSGTGSLKQRASLLRTGTGFSLSGRANANAPTAPRQGASTQNTQALDTVPEQSDSGCCCIIC
ncbi:hypothetical protein CPB86DRAFT_772103 [Serendipita vermifera]|nr:hypothetical protein CPB86DRAFT_772103 [Serendipita vermifera]